MQIHQSISTLPIPFDTDEADHANAAIELYNSLRFGSYEDISRSITRQAFYPPLHSIFTAVSYSIFGPSWSSSRIPSLFFFIVSTILLGTATYNITKNQIATLVTLIGFSTSHIILLNSSLSMLELCGVFAVCLSLYLLTLEKWQNILLFSLSCFLIFLSKYNFAITAIPGLFCIFITPRTRPYVNLKFITPTLLIFILCVGWIVLSSPYSFISFLTGHPSYAPLLSSENLLFEIKSWIFEYSCTPLIAAIYLFIAYIGATKTSHISIRAACGIVIFSFIVLLLSTTNETRHFMVAAPAIFFLSGIGLDTNSKIFQKLAIVFMLLTLSVHLYKLPTLHKEISQEMEGHPDYGRLQEFIISSIDSHKPALIIGTTDEFSLEGLQWLAAAKWNTLYSKIEMDQFPFRADKDVTALKRQRNRDYPFINTSFPKEPLQSVLDTHYYQYIVAIRKVGARDSTFEIIKELQSILQSNVVKTLKLEDREVLVYSLNLP